VALEDLDAVLVRAAVGAQTGVAAAPAEIPDAVLPVSAVTVAEMAARMGCSTRYVRKLISLKRLQARRTSAGWLVTVPDAEPALVDA